jgi:putative effector of murein hydrolase
MPEILSLPLFSLCLTLGAYLLGLWCKEKVKHSLCNPFMIAVVLVGAFLLLSKMPMADYQKGIDTIGWLLTPATVALAVPLYEKLKELKSNLPAILAGVVAGAVSSLGMVLGLCVLFALPREISISLLPKSITTAMAIPLVEPTVGLVPLTTSAVIISGIIGSMAGQAMCRLFGIRHPIAQGVAYGTASHVIGTSRATELNELTGAVGSLSLVIAGVLTAVLYPFAMMIFM